MARWSLVAWAVRAVLASVCVVIAIRLFAFGWHIPLEAGGILFMPLCVVGGLLLLWVALLVVFPRAWRRPGFAFWSSLVDLIKPL